MPSAISTWIRAQGLTRGFGRLRVLQNIDLEAVAGELLLVTGHNGSGKSTLLRCLAGLMAPQRGTVECQVAGRELDVEARRLAVGFVSPDLELYSELTTAVSGLSAEQLLADASSSTPMEDPSVLGVLSFYAWHEAYHVGGIGMLRAEWGYRRTHELVMESM